MSQKNFKKFATNPHGILQHSTHTILAYSDQYLRQHWRCIKNHLPYNIYTELWYEISQNVLELVNGILK